MPDDFRHKTFNYRRAVWIGNGAPEVLEDCLSRAHGALPTTAARTFASGRLQLQGAKFLCRPEVGLFLHVSLSVPDQHAALVARPCAQAEAAVRTLPPPATDDYVDGDVMAMVRGNHLVFCAHNAHESALVGYLERCLHACGYEDPRGMFSFEKVASADKLSLLQAEGVRAIQLGASLYEASVDHFERVHQGGQETLGKRLVGRVVEELVELFREDPDPELRELHEKENLQVRLEIRFNSRKSGGEIGRKRIEAAAGRIVEEEEDEGFTIRTRGGKTLTASEVRLSARKGVRVYGNTISVGDAWEKLEVYLGELRGAGLLEQ